MRLLSVRYLGLFASSLLMITTFQNCGQAGALNNAGTSLAKSDAPLVVDVVGEIQNQLPPVADSDAAVEHVDYIKHENEDDIVFDNELENVLKDHACGDNSSKKVLVCHYPQGNPSNRHEICIGRAALRAHLSHSADAAHMDHLGACPADETKN